MLKTDRYGHFLCNHCNDILRGHVEIAYKYEDDWPETAVGVHKACIPAYLAAQKGLKFPCPKCKTTGLVEVTKAAPSPEGPCNYTGEDTCSLCGGAGFLDKEPIPVIIDWKKAT